MALICQVSSPMLRFQGSTLRADSEALPFLVATEITPGFR